MSEIIKVDFIIKKKVGPTLTAWKCLICNNDYQTNDEGEKVSRVVVRNETRKHPQQCVCKECSVTISKLVQQCGWENNMETGE